MFQLCAYSTELETWNTSSYCVNLLQVPSRHGHSSWQPATMARDASCFRGAYLTLRRSRVCFVHVCWHGVACARRVIVDRKRETRETGICCFSLSIAGEFGEPGKSSQAAAEDHHWWYMWQCTLAGIVPWRFSTFAHFWQTPEPNSTRFL